MKTTMLATEVCNRFIALPAFEKTAESMVRLTVEVTRELLATQPEAVDDYLRACAAERRAH